MRVRPAMLSLAVFLAAAAPALAQVPPQPVPPAPRHPVPGQRLNNWDRQFVREALLDGYFEIDMGRLAERNASAANVKRYGGWMVEDNQSIDASLSALAERKGIQAPRALNPRHIALLDRFENLQGRQFDGAYLTAMVQDHDNEIRAFNHEVTNGTDPDLRRFARQTLQHLSRYDQLAHQMNQSLAGVGASAARRR
ncbi:MAG TPA: DUF4142 domain-containing protein [Stellaceae bacterium]|nr:DUF4142 domain-containing protein [Stellaceae bacterium]